MCFYKFDNGESIQPDYAKGSDHYIVVPELRNLNTKKYLAANKIFNEEVQYFGNSTEQFSIKEILHVYDTAGKTGPKLSLPLNTFVELKAFTIELWVAFEELITGSYSILGMSNKSWDQGFAIGLSITVNKAIVGCVLNSSLDFSTTSDCYSGKELCKSISKTKTWYHISCSRIDDTAGMIMVNNDSFIKTTEDPLIYITAKGLFDSGDLVIGSKGNDKGFNGYIRELRIWSKALSREETISMMNTAIDPLDYKNLIAYWPLIDGKIDNFIEISLHSVQDVIEQNPNANSIYGGTSHKWVYDYELWTLPKCHKDYFYYPLENSCKRKRKNIGLYLSDTKLNTMIKEKPTNFACYFSIWVIHINNAFHSTIDAVKINIIGIENFEKMFWYNEGLD